MTDEVKPLSKLEEPVVRVRHSDLKRFDDGNYKSVCPVCDTGILLMSRVSQTFQLKRLDRCTYCAQQVYYLDDTIAGEKLPEVN